MYFCCCFCCCCVVRSTWQTNSSDRLIPGSIRIGEFIKSAYPVKHANPLLTRWRCWLMVYNKIIFSCALHCMTVVINGWILFCQNIIFQLRSDATSSVKEVFNANVKFGLFSRQISEFRVIILSICILMKHWGLVFSIRTLYKLHKAPGGPQGPCQVFRLLSNPVSVFKTDRGEYEAVTKRKKTHESEFQGKQSGKRVF